MEVVGGWKLGRWVELYELLRCDEFKNFMGRGRWGGVLKRGLEAGGFVCWPIFFLTIGRTIWCFAEGAFKLWVKKGAGGGSAFGGDRCWKMLGR